MGALVTLELPGDSPMLDLPWIITFGPLSEEEDWEPVVCGPYERPHALALAESVLADEDLMAVVEPVLPHLSAEQILGDVAAARLAVESEPVESELTEPRLVDSEYLAEHGAEDGAEYGVEVGRAGFGVGPQAGLDAFPSEPATPPTPDEIKAGFARIAARLTA
jgi:hypothetical protein